MPFQLSYIICTYNRLPFLEITLSKLFENLRENEEIVVVDGQSTDGTQVYLENLFNKGLIHQYISEPDRNQAHGWNKALLMAKGTIIKKIIDDDVFDFRSIQICANFMMANPAVDVIISNDLSSKLLNPTDIAYNTRLSHYQAWAKKEVPSFTFGDVHMLIRKSALALIGLYHVGYTMMDWEYSLKISYVQANIVYYTGYNALSVFQQESVSGQSKLKELVLQGKRALAFYEYAGDLSKVSVWSKIKIAIGKRILKPATIQPEQKEAGNLAETYRDLYTAIEYINHQGKFSFITRQNCNEA